MHITKRGKHEYAKDYAWRTIKENIISLELEPGSMVSEKELSMELGLSRGPVREALIDFNKVQMVEVYPQRGSFIALIDYDLIEQASFMREALELGAVERCCNEGMKEQILSKLNENVRLQRFYLDEGNWEKVWYLDNEFHKLLFTNARLAQLYTYMIGFQVHFDRVRAMTLESVKLSRTVADHEEILDLIINCEVEEAKKHMHIHLTRYQDHKDDICARFPNYIKNNKNL